jgi:hypothetical protein
MEGSGCDLIEGTTRNLFGGTEENYEEPVRISGLRAEICSPGTLEYEAGVSIVRLFL